MAITEPTGGMAGAPDFVAQDFRGAQGINYSGLVWGSTIPISAGFRKINGSVIWASPLILDYDKPVTEYSPQIPGTDPHEFGHTTQTHTVKRTFAVALGKRLDPTAPAPEIRRIWADGTLVYSNGSSFPLVYDHVAGAYNNSAPLGSGTGNNLGTGGVPGDAVVTVEDPAANGSLQTQSTLSFRFYEGTEDQMPDEAVVAALGNLAPAFRGLMYMVIEGLKIGTGWTVTNFGHYDFQSGSGDIEEQQTVPDFPQISVELMDSASASTIGHNALMIEGGQPFEYTDQILLANWGTREVVVVSPSISGGGGTMHTLDMDSATETQAAHIPNAEAIGTTGAFACWDVINDVIYTEMANDHCLCAVDHKSASVVSSALRIGVNLAPFNVDNTAITNEKPAIGFPRPFYGVVSYTVEAGVVYPMVFAGRTWAAAFTPSANGSLKSLLLPKEFVQISSDFPNQIRAIKAFPLADQAVNKARLDYQDAAFVVSYGSRVDIVYVTARQGGTGRESEIIGRQNVYISARADGRARAMLDQHNNIVVQDYLPSNPTLLTKIGVNLAGATDYTIAPGWRGLFPEVTGTLFDRVSDGEAEEWEHNSMNNSDISTGLFSPWSNQIVNLSTATVKTVTGLAGLDSFSSGNVWDSVNSIRFFHHVQAVPSTYGHGFMYAQVFNGSGADVNSLGNYLHAFAIEAGYTNADLDIDATLTDEVPGVLILQAYDLPTLFKDIGDVYGFTYFNSAGKLKFRRSSNNPIKATAVWTQSSTGVTNGATVTIGSYTYTFRNTPAAPFDVAIGTDTVVSTSPPVTNPDAMEKTTANLAAAIAGDASLGEFFPGTLTNSLCTAFVPKTDDFGGKSITCTAIIGGVVGNTIAVGTTGVNNSWGHATFTGGEDPPDADLILSLDDFAPCEENQLSQHDSLVTTIAPLGQGQQAASINYYAMEQDYIPATQTYIPDDQGGLLANVGSITQAYNVPFVMSTSEAYDRVAKAAIRAGDNVVSQQFRVTQSFLLIEPSDVVSISLEPFSYTVRIDEATFNGDYSTSVTALNYSFRTDFPVNVSDSHARLPQSVPTANDCIPVVMDAPLLEPLFRTDVGFFTLFNGVRAYRANFGQGSLSFGQFDGPLLGLFNTTNDVKWGTLRDILPTAVEPFYRTVEDSILINTQTIRSVDLASASYADFVAGKNCLAIGAPGRWEYIFFRDVEILNPKVARLTGLIRAQRGTDAAVIGHDATDIALLLTSVAAGFAQQPLHPQAFEGTQFEASFRYVASGLPARRAPVTTTVTAEGLVLWPFSPCLLTATLVGGNDIDVAWVRRDRLGTEFVTIDQPMSEATERYDIEIFSGADMVRTVVGLTASAFTYTAAQQTEDGFTPGTISTLSVRVYQKGELGRGFPRVEDVNVE